MTGTQFTLYTISGECPSSEKYARDQVLTCLCLRLGPGPNPVKIAIALELLGLQYDCIPLSTGVGKGSIKDPDYVSKVNPNGRAPGLVDHGNEDFSIGESGAILRYLADKVYCTSTRY